MLELTKILNTGNGKLVTFYWYAA